MNATMGVDIVAIVPNVKGRTQEEADKEFGVQKFELPDGETKIYSIWKLFEWEGKSYATWYITPRYVEPDTKSKKWEALRKYFRHVMDFFGADVIYYGSDVIFLHEPEDASEDFPFFLPLELASKYIAEPDYEKYPYLKEVRELEGLVW